MLCLWNYRGVCGICGGSDCEVGDEMKIINSIKTILFGRLPMMEENKTLEVNENEVLAEGVLAVITEEEVKEFKANEDKRLAVKTMLNNLVEEQAKVTAEGRALWSQVQKKYGIAEEGKALTLNHITREIMLAK
jgi:hypothetical protein